MTDVMFMRMAVCQALKTEVHDDMDIHRCPKKKAPVIGCAIRQSRQKGPAYMAIPIAFGRNDYAPGARVLANRPVKGLPPSNRQVIEKARHAEENAVVFAKYTASGDIEGATVYVTHAPCFHCTTLLVQHRVKRVLYLFDFDGSAKKSCELFAENDITCAPLPEEGHKLVLQCFTPFLDKLKSAEARDDYKRPIANIYVGSEDEGGFYDKMRRDYPDAAVSRWAETERGQRERVIVTAAEDHGVGQVARDPMLLNKIEEMMSQIEKKIDEKHVENLELLRFELKQSSSTNKRMKKRIALLETKRNVASPPVDIRAIAKELERINPVTFHHLKYLMTALATQICLLYVHDVVHAFAVYLGGGTRD